jgi:hypothetical protein
VLQASCGAKEEAIMLSRRVLIAGVLAGSALAGGHASAQDQATVGIQTTTHYSIDGRIAAVDTNARTLTITSADGTQRMLNVSPMAANITSTKVGDNVLVGVEDTRTFVLSSPGVQTPASGAASVAGAVETSQGVAAPGSPSRSATGWLWASILLATPSRWSIPGAAKCAPMT